MGDRKYVDDSSPKIARLGDKLDVIFKISSSLKAVTSRVRTNPKSVLVDAVYTVQSGNNIVFVPIKVADLVAFRLPPMAVELLLVFSPKGNTSGEELTVVIKLAQESLEIIGKRDAVVDLCSWLYVPIWGNV